MQLVWIMTEGHEYDIFGELAAEEADGLVVHRPAMVTYAGGGYMLRPDILPFYSIALNRQGIALKVPSRNIVFSIRMTDSEHAGEPIVQEYRAYLEDQGA